MVEKWKDKNVPHIVNMDYVLRLQALDGYQAKFNEVFNDRFTRLIYVHHTGKKGDNPHYHFCFTCDYKKEALRKYLKGHFDLAKGNKHLSLKDWDGSPDACAYLFHERTKVMNVKGFTDEEYEQFFRRNEEVQNSHTKVPVILERVMKNILGHEVFTLTGMYKPPYDEKKFLFKQIMYEIRRTSDWVPNRFQMERYINKLRLMLNTTDSSFETFITNLYHEYFG